jgi:hypothetical protein
MNPFLLSLFLCAAVVGLLHFGLRGHRYAWFMLGALVPMAVIAMLGHFELLHPREDPVKNDVRRFCDDLSDELRRDLRWHDGREQRWIVVQGYMHRFQFCALLRPQHYWRDDATRTFLTESSAYRDDGDETRIDRIAASADTIARQLNDN